MNTDVEGAITVWGVIAIPIVLVGALFLCDFSNDKEQVQIEAIAGGYASYNEHGIFKWNHEIEQENLLKDLEFFKRLEKSRGKSQAAPEIVPLPKTQDLFN